MIRIFISLLLLSLAGCLFNSTKELGKVKPGDPIDTALVRTVTVSVSAITYNPSASTRSTWGTEDRWRYGQPMKSAVSVHSNGNLSVAWAGQESDSNKLILTRTTDAGVKIGNDLILSDSVSRNKLLGLAALGDTGYAYGIVPKGEVYKYVFRITDANNSIKFDTTVIGGGDLEAVGSDSKQNPTQASSSRIVFNSSTGKIAIYFGHLQKYSDGIKHQGGFLKFYDTQGNEVGTNRRGDNGWLYSHNFDQRIKTDGSHFILAAHGDAYPRALPISLIDADGKSKGTEVLQIPGNVGDNTTNTQIGDLVVLPDGYAFSYATLHGRATRDVAFSFLDKELNNLNQVWLTAYPGTEGEYAFNVKAARYGENVAVGWELVKSGARRDSAEVFFAVVNLEGKIISGPTKIPGVRFNINDDLFNYINGDVGWVTGEGTTLRLHRFRLRTP